MTYAVANVLRGGTAMTPVKHHEQGIVCGWVTHSNEQSCLKIYVQL